MSSLSDIWNIPNSVTADKIWRPREKMTKEQAEAMLIASRKHKPGAIPEEFLAEAREVMNAQNNPD